MPTKTVFNLKIDKTTKQEAAKLAERMGMSLGAVVNSFLRNYIQTQELHVTAAPRMTPYLEGVITKARQDWILHKNISGPFDSKEQVVKHLRGLMRNK